MKRITTILALSISVIGLAQQAEVVNGLEGFENWNPAEVGELPIGWDGFNKNVQFNGMTVGTVECVKKSAVDPYEGNFSVSIENTPIMGGPAVPGILTVGDFVVDWNAQDGDIEGGEAYTQLPSELSGHFKYTPVGIDTGFVSVWFLENGQQVGSGRTEFFGTTSDWTSFTVDINFNAGATPDSMNMMFSSSALAAPPTGSRLEIDAIAFQAFLSTKNQEISEVLCYPNPTSDHLQIEWGKPVRGTVDLIDVNGKIVLSKITEGSSVKMNISDVPSGIYHLKLKTERTVLMETIVIE